MGTLAHCFDRRAQTIAVVVPSKPNALQVSYALLSSTISSFQSNLAALGIGPGSAVSIALPNSFDFIVAFLASSWQRAVAAPLNPGYKEDEFEFYIDDLSSSLVVVPEGAFLEDAPVVRAAWKYNTAIAECYWNGSEVVLDLKHQGKLQDVKPLKIQAPRPEDVALVLHTSGTTGRPKAVRIDLGQIFQPMSI